MDIIADVPEVRRTLSLNIFICSCFDYAVQTFNKWKSRANKYFVENIMRKYRLRKYLCETTINTVVIPLFYY